MPLDNPATPANGGEASPVRYRTALVDGITMFYREAGNPGAPVILLLHGFPSSSRMFATLIPLLSSRYRLIAPDFPGYAGLALRSVRHSTPVFADLRQVGNAASARIRRESRSSTNS